MDEANKTRFGAFAEIYDKARPRPPRSLAAAVLDYWRQGAGTDRAPVVSDIGAGTGLSTVPWLGLAARVIAVEPDARMLEALRAKLGSAGPDGSVVETAQGGADALPLSDATVDIITASQSFHWMNPQTAVPEIVRALASGGLFVAYDCHWPVLICPRLDRAYELLFEGLREIEITIQDRQRSAAAGSGLDPGIYYPKEKHVESLRTYGDFLLVCEAGHQNREEVDRDRYLGIAYSQGSYQAHLAAAPDQVGPLRDAFEAVVDDEFARGPRTMWVNYRLRIAAKGR